MAPFKFLGRKGCNPNSNSHQGLMMHQQYQVHLKGRRVRDCKSAAARTASSSSYNYNVDKDSSGVGYRVRVLRYPDGYERVLRYPIDYKRSGKERTAQAQASSTFADQPPHNASWDITGAEALEKPPAVETKQQPLAGKSKASVPVEESTEEKPSTIPDTPTELLRKQRSEEFLMSSKLEWEYAKSSFEILDSCPWLEPRPLWVLGTLDSSGNVQTFTLRTRVGKQDMEDELEMLTGKRIEVSHLTDGLVTFESKGVAEHFAEENSTSSTELFVFEVASHELFQMTTEAKAVVVLMKNTKSNPTARMLAAVLRDQKSTF